MKKIYSLLLVALMATSLSLQAREHKVNSDAALSSAWAGAQAGDVILLAPGTYAMGSSLKFPINNKGVGTIDPTGPARCFTVKAQYADRDSMPVLITDIGQPANPTDGTPPIFTSGATYRGGLIFENIDLRQRVGATGSSGHIIYVNQFDGILHIDSLVFRNCIISESPRGLVRTVVGTKPNPEYDAVTNPDVPQTVPKYDSSGDLEYFELTNCLIHDIFVTPGNNWPLIYLSHAPIEMHIVGNTAYNMPYMKHFFTMAYAVAQSNTAAAIQFKNNTFLNTFATNAYISLGSYLAFDATYTFENNIFALPDWADDRNLSPDSTQYAIPYILRCVGGIVTAKNNLFIGPYTIDAGNSTDSEQAFHLYEVENDYTAEGLGFSWDAFADRQRGDFSYLASSPLATAGTGGGPIGDPRWFKNFANPVTLTVTADNDNAAVTPRRAYYNSGDAVKVQTSIVDGANFMGWKQQPAGTQLSTDNPYLFNITANTDLLASYEAAQNRNVEFAVSGSALATVTVSPLKDEYYVNDTIIVTVNPHIDEFLGWSDGSQDLVRQFIITEHINLTVNFKAVPYLLAWDTDVIPANNTVRELAPDHSADTTLNAVMGYVVADTAAFLSGRNNKYNGASAPKVEVHNCVVRRTDDLTKPSYLYIKFSTLGLSNLVVKSLISSDNAIYQTQKMQYSLDGQNYTDFASIEIPADAAAWDEVWLKDFTGALPAEANDKETVYVRWIADSTTERFTTPRAATTPPGEFLYIAKVIVSRSMGDGDATWRVDPYVTYTPGEKIERRNITLTLGSAENFVNGGNVETQVFSIAQEVQTLNDVEYVARLNGSANPRGTYTAGDPATVPAYGTFWKFEPAENGELTLAMYVNAGKSSYITEDGLVVGEYNAFTVNSAGPYAYTINVTAGKTYQIWSEGSKMGIFGFVFKSETAVKETRFENRLYSNGGILYVETEQAAEAEIYTVLGQKIAGRSLNAGTNAITGLQQSGIYIVKIGSEAQKVIIR